MGPVGRKEDAAHAPAVLKLPFTDLLPAAIVSLVLVLTIPGCPEASTRPAPTSVSPERPTRRFRPPRRRTRSRIPRLVRLLCRSQKPAPIPETLDKEQERLERKVETLARAQMTRADPAGRRQLLKALDALVDVAAKKGNLDRIVFLRRAQAAVDPSSVRTQTLARTLAAVGRYREARAIVASLLKTANGQAERTLREEAAGLDRRTAEQNRPPTARHRRRSRRFARIAQRLRLEGRYKEACRFAVSSYLLSPCPRKKILAAEVLNEMARPRLAAELRSQALALAEQKGLKTTGLRPFVYDRPWTAPWVEGHKYTRIADASADGRLVAAAYSNGKVALWGVPDGRLHDVLDAHGQMATTLSFGPRGRLLVTGGGEGLVKVWDTWTGRLRQTLRGHQGAIRSVSMSPGGVFVASAGSDGTIRLGSVVTGGTSKVICRDPDVRSVSIAKGLVAFASGKRVAVWTANRVKKQDDKNTTKKARTTLRTFGTTGAYSVAFGPGGRWLAAGGARKTTVWEVRSGRMVRQFATPSVSVHFGPRGRWLAAVKGHLSADRARLDKEIRVWDVPTGHLLRTFRDSTRSASSVTVGPRRRYLFARNLDGTVNVWDLTTGGFVRTMGVELEKTERALFSPDGKLLLSGGADKTIKQWNLVTGSLDRTLAKVDRPVSDLNIGWGGRVLASVHPNDEVNLWNLQTGKLLDPPTGISGQRALVAAKTGRAVTVDRADGVRVWDLELGKLLMKIRMKAPRQKWAQALLSHQSAIGPNGRWVAVQDGSRIKIFDMRRQKLRWTLRERAEYLAITPDGRRLLLVHTDKLTVWDLVVEKKLREIDLPFGVAPGPPAFGPDGRLAASATRHGVLVWDLSTGQKVRTIAFRPEADRPVRISIAPDGKWMAAANGPYIELWDFVTGTPLVKFAATRMGDSFVITPDGYLDAPSDRRWLVGFRAPHGTFDWGLAWDRYHVPDLLRRVLEGDTSFRFTALRMLVAKAGDRKPR